MKTHRLLGYARKNFYLYVFCALMLILQISIRVIAPTLLARIVDEVIGGGNYAIHVFCSLWHWHISCLVSWDTFKSTPVTK